MSTGGSIQSATGSQVEYKLRVAAVLGFVAALCFLCTHIVILGDKAYAFIPEVDSTTYANPPFRRLIEFSDAPGGLVAFYIRVKHSSSEELLSAGSWEEYLDSCAPFSDAEHQCQYDQQATNTSVHKTFSLGILQHPGWAVVGYGLSGFGMLFCAGVVAVLVADMLLLYVAMASYTGLLYALAAPEVSGAFYFAALVLALCCVLAFHLLLAFRTGRWYHARHCYRVVAWVSIALSCVLAITSLALPDSLVHVCVQTVVIALLVLAQLFVCHIMYLMSPVTVAVVLPTKCLDVRVAFDLNLDDLGDIEGGAGGDVGMQARPTAIFSIAEEADNVTHDDGAKPAAAPAQAGSAAAAPRADADAA